MGDSTNKLVFTVLLGPWTAGDEGAEGTFVDENEVEDPSDELVRLAAHAHDAGIIEVTEGLDESHIQSQEDGEAAQEASKGEWVERTWNADGTANPGHWDGPWAAGNQAQYDLEQAQKRVAVARALVTAIEEWEGDEDPPATAEEAADELAAAEENLATVDADIQERLAE